MTRKSSKVSTQPSRKPRSRTRRQRERRKHQVLVSDWRRFYRWASIWFCGAIGSIASLYEFVPTLQKWLPDGSFHYLMTVLAICAIVARLVNQEAK